MSELKSQLRSRTLEQNEEFVHYLDGAYKPGHCFVWPDVADSQARMQYREPLVATIDGEVAGRVFFEAELYPLAELVNLYVSPHHRRRGVGDFLVKDLVKRAIDLGYGAIHLQTHLDNTAAQRLYSRNGFLPAQRGEMLRMVRILYMPLLTFFLHDHPLIRFDSRPSEDGPGSWILEWSDMLSRDRLEIALSGGSCQRDSDGIGPGIAGIRLVSKETDASFSIGGTASVFPASDFAVEVTITNSGRDELPCLVRPLLNHGFAPGAESDRIIECAVPSDESRTLTIPVSLLESFDRDFWKYSSYSSASVGVEVFLGSTCFWMAHQLRAHL